MDLKVKVYSLMPGWAKAVLTRAYIQTRARREKALANSLPVASFDDPPGTPELVYITGFPRCGTTMMKYYLGSYPGLVQTKFDPVGFYKTWTEAQAVEEILVDKSNHYIYSVANIFRACGSQVRLACVVRDPRDCLVSFQKYHENREVPRSERFWRYWASMHRDFLSTVREAPVCSCVFVVRYEDLVRHPAEAKAAFLSWIGIEVDASTLDDTYTIAHEGEGWHDSVHDHRTVGGFALEKWRQADASDATLQRLLGAWRENPEAAELMALFGYAGDDLCEHSMKDEPFAVFEVPDA